MTGPAAAPGVRGAVRALRAAQKSSRGVPAYSRFVNRPLGRVLAAVAYTAGRTPNQVTAVSAVCTFTAIALVALVPPTAALAAAVVLLLVLGYALDSADGQLARLRGGGSLTGEWLDHVVDSAKNVSVHLAVLVSFYRFWDLPSESLLLVPLLFTLVASVTFLAFILTEKLRPAGVPRGAEPADGPPPLLRSLLVAPADYGALCLVFAVFAVPTLFLVLYGTLLVASSLYLAAALVKWFREMAGLDTARRAARGRSHPADGVNASR